MVSDERVLEARGAKVDEAIENGLERLGAQRENVEIEVLDEGSSGFLGLGAREAVVRLTLREPSKPADAIGTMPASAIPPVREPQPAAPAEPSEAESPEEPLADDDIPEEEVAQNIVEILLQKMQVDATVSLDQTEPDDLTGERRWIVDIRGSDLGMLIGPRGETLNALQYMARLMTGHVMRQRPKFIVDIEGYRKRREQALARLANRMAEKAMKGGRQVTLEPMPANERRIIHITLRDHDRVRTESVGEGNRRKVQILLK